MSESLQLSICSQGDKYGLAIAEESTEVVVVSVNVVVTSLMSLRPGTDGKLWKAASLIVVGGVVIGVGGDTTRPSTVVGLCKSLLVWQVGVYSLEVPLLVQVLDGVVLA